MSVVMKRISKIWSRVGDRRIAGLVTGVGSVLFSILGGCLLLYKIPYGFETNDQFQYFLLPYRSIFRDFLIGDWFTWETSHYHLTFSWIIRGLYALFGATGFPTAVFVMHFMVLTAIAYALLRLARSMNGGWFAALFALCVVAFVKRMGVAETTVNHGVLLPSDMALPFFLIALSFWIERRPLRTGLFLGVAGFIHANYAVLGPLVIAGPELMVLIRTKKVKETLKMAGIYVAVASPTLVGTLTAFLTTDSAPAALRVLFNVRSPHHYNPPLANSSDLIFMSVVVLAGLPVWLSRIRKSYRHVGILLALVISQLIAIWAANMQQPTLVRLFFWRLSLSLMLFGAVGVGALITHAFKERDWAKMCFGISAVVVIAAFSTAGKIVITPQLRLEGFGWLAAALLVQLLYLPLCRLRPLRPYRYVFAQFPLLFTMLLSTQVGLVSARNSVNWESALKNWQRTYEINSKVIDGKKRKEPIFTWIAKHTPKTASFLIPPGTNGFRFEARRAAFVDWKCCPMRGDEIKEWKRRMLTVMGTKRFPSKGYALHRVSNQRYHARSLASLAKLAREEGVSHILARKQTGYQKAGLKKLSSKAGWTVFEVERSL